MPKGVRLTEEDIQNRVGLKNEKLEVLEYLGRDKFGHVTYRFKCKCGDIIDRDWAAFARGQGCVKCRTQSNYRHGERDTRVYRIWNAMKNRCGCPNFCDYHNYGGRGIKVCDEWLEFLPFRDWALSSGYSDDLTLDRSNNDLGYSPENCRWISFRDQQNNRRNNHYVTIGEETKSITDWARVYNVPAYIIRDRIRRNWDKIEAITTPHVKTKDKKCQ